MVASDLMVRAQEGREACVGELGAPAARSARPSTATVWRMRCGRSLRHGAHGQPRGCQGLARE
eukprot:7272328-Prymnesium_polylepis.1